MKQEKIDLIESYIKNKKFDNALDELNRESVSCSDTYDLNRLFGILHSEKREPIEAKPYFLKALKISPDNSEAYYCLGRCYHDLNNLEEAGKQYQKSLELDGNNVLTLMDYGSLCNRLGKYEDAEKYFNKIIEIHPDITPPFLNLAIVYRAQGKTSLAIESLKKALVIKPGDVACTNNLTNIFTECCRHKEAYSALEDVLKSNSKVPSYVYHNYLFNLHYSDEIENDCIMERHKEWGKKTLDEINDGFVLPVRLPVKERRLRIGYVSGDFRVHSVGFFIQSIVKNHSASDFELFFYYNNNVDDQLTNELKKYSTIGWREIANLTNEEIVEIIREDRIDILIDLSGHTDKNKLEVFAYKPAPLQVTYLGYPNTTGLKTIDYRLVDSFTDPEDCGSDVVETLIRLDECFLCYQPFKHIEPKNKKRTQNSKITFGSFNNSKKLNTSTIRVWCEILKKVPESVLFLKSSVFSDEDIKNEIKKLFISHNIDSDRLIFKGRITGYEDHMREYEKVDICLDPFPYNGTTTTFEALYMGCPVITLEGERHSGRVGFSILTNLHMEQYIACNEHDYVTKAVQLAKDRDNLVELQNSLRSRLVNSTLMDGFEFTRKLEQAYRNVWHKYCDDVGTIKPLEIEIRNKIRVCVPDSLELITPFVLKEQEDWFEPEMGFVREYIQPGMTVIDVGANYGLYTTCFGKQVGPKGKVFAFEPVSSTAAYLKMSVKKNDMSWVKVVEAGGSNGFGHSILSLEANAEMNHVVYEMPEVGEYERIALYPLDGIVEEFEIEKLDFLKIDAEGEEEKIISISEVALEQNSPLIMYALKHGVQYNSSLNSMLERKKYANYYYVEALGGLVPLTNNVDPYLLNLFACKTDLADRLTDRGLLCNKLIAGLPVQLDQNEVLKFWQSMEYYPFFSNIWKEDIDLNYAEALKFYIAFADHNNPISARYSFLSSSFHIMKEFCETSPTLPRLMSLVRVAYDIGDRHYANNVVSVILDLFENADAQLSLNEPFLTVLTRYQNIDPGDNIGNWCLSQILEAKVKNERHSSYYDLKHESLSSLEMIRQLGFQSEEMERRRQLLKMRQKGHVVAEKAEILKRYTKHNLNPKMWV